MSSNHANQQLSTRVHVVGDLHGQLADLLHVLDDAGMPSRTNRCVWVCFDTQCVMRVYGDS